MKSIYAILVVLFPIFLCAQNSSETYDKTISVIIKDFSEACGEDAGDAIFCLTDERGVKMTERYSCIMDANVWQVEPKDLITNEWVLNPKYKGKKATLYCMKHSGGAGWVVKKVSFDNSTASSNSNNPIKKENSISEIKKFTGMITSITKASFGYDIVAQAGMDDPDVMQLKLNGIRGINYSAGRFFERGSNLQLKEIFLNKKFSISYQIEGEKNVIKKIELEKDVPISFEKDAFPTATCKVYNLEGKLLAIVENNTIFQIKNGKKDMDDGKPIQNKDEVCIKTTCAKVKVDATGCVNVYALPNVTDATGHYKIIGDKICCTIKKGCDVDETEQYYHFKGNKTQAALIALIGRMGKGSSME